MAIDAATLDRRGFAWNRRVLRRLPAPATALLGLVSLATLAFLVLPTLLVIPMSFNGGRYLAFPPESWSVKWYWAYFQDQEWMSATLFSLQVAALTAVVTTVIGTMAAVAMVRGNSRALAVLSSLTLAPMVVPPIVIAVAMYLVFARLRMTGTVLGLVIAHSVLAVPYVILTVSSALYQVDTALEMAALNLGASRLASFRWVVFPLIRPGVLGGAAFAFIASLDEAVVAVFLSSATGQTLTRKLFEDIDYSLSPIVAVVATVLTVFSVGAMAAVQIAQGLLLRRKASARRARADAWA